MTSVPAAATVEKGLEGAPQEAERRRRDPENRELEQAVRAYRMEELGKVADELAHDFTNVLAVILSYANFIKDSSPAGDSRRDDALEILLAAGEGSALVRRLLSLFAHVTAEKPIELNESVAHLHALLIRSLGEYRELRILNSRSPLSVRIDPIRFDELVLGLTLAAADTVPNGGVLQILLEESGEPHSAGPAACLTIQRGEGMISSRVPPTEPRPRTRPNLDAWQKIVERAGGTLEAPGGEEFGPRFVVRLPLCLDSTDALPGLEAAPGHGPVLVAEAEPALRRAAARALERAGYEVLVAANYHEAVALLSQLGARLETLVSDLAMAGCERYELVAEARRRSPAAALLVTSVFAEQGAELPADVVHLYKPVQPNELVNAVRAAHASPLPPASVGAAASGLVLVVEDDDALRAALTRMLECAGYSVYAAGRLAEARQSLESGAEPALVLCDLSLPDGSSTELIDWILATRPRLRGRVFLLSGGAVEESDVAFLKRGVVPALRKPVDPGSLLQMLERARAGSEEGA